MKDGERQKLRWAVAEAIWKADMSPHCALSDTMEPVQQLFLARADAALAVAEPAVREALRPFASIADKVWPAAIDRQTVSDVVPDGYIDTALIAYHRGAPHDPVASMRAALAAVLPLAIAAERERCARVAEAHPELPQHGAAGQIRHGQLYACEHIAAAIRRGDV